MPSQPKDWNVEPEMDGIPNEAQVHIKVTSMEEGLWGQRGDEDKFCIIVKARIRTIYDHGKEITRFKNLPYDFKFTLGWEEDKNCDKAESWKRYPAQQYGRFLQACGYSLNAFASTEDACEQITADQPELMFENQRRARRDDPDGKKYNNPIRFKKMGTSDLNVANGLDKDVKRVAPAAARKAVVQEAYVEDDE